MKCNFLLFLFVLTISSITGSIYEINVISIEGNSISLSKYRNKKIIITTISATNPNTEWLKYLDSLQKSDTSLQVIAVPSNDFAGIGNDEMISDIKDSLSPHILMLKSALLKKNAGSNQHVLYKWLTDVNENRHFDLDVQSPGQVFIISRNGILYGILRDDVSTTVLNQTLNEDITE